MPLTDEERLERKRAKNRARQKAFRFRKLNSKDSEAYRTRRKEDDIKSKKKKKVEANIVSIALHGNLEANSEMVAEEAMSILAAAAAGASAELSANEAVFTHIWSFTANPDEVHALPNYRTGSVITCPPTLNGDNAMAAIVLEGLSLFLQKNWDSDEMTTVRRLTISDAPESTGIREISGNRYEFYVLVKNKIPAAFKTILLHSEKSRLANNDIELTDDDLSRLIRLIVGFAAGRALSSLPEGYILQNFSYIVSRGEERRQDMHIDLCVEDHFQFGMLCSPKGELTSEYGCLDFNNLVQKGYNLTQIWDDLPEGLQDKLERFEEIQPLLDGYGPLLSHKIKKINVKTMWTFGTMLRLPGRVMHCGPAVTEQDQLRAVLFFTATPNEDTAKAYDSERQYCRTTIICDILMYSWLTLEPTEKEYMLSKWAEVGLSEDSEDAIKVNMVHKHLIVIAKALKKADEKDLATLISEIAWDPTWDRETDKWDVRWRDLRAKKYKIPHTGKSKK